MANNRPPSLQLFRYHTTFSSFILLLLASQPPYTSAQPQNSPAATSSTSSAPSASPTDNTPLLANPSNGDTFLTPTPNPARPSATDNANYGSHDDGDQPQDRGILNYYFLLLAVFIVIVILTYWSIARRRKNRISQLRDNQQSALARDLETWPGIRSRRWSRTAGADTRAEDGLDERGEAPPPYLKEPEPVHHDGREGVELHDLSRREGKPPDYDEGPSGR